MSPHLILLSGIYGGDSISFTRPIACYQLKHWLSHFGIKAQVIEFCGLMSSQTLAKSIAKFVGPETIGVGVSSSFWRTLPLNIDEAIRLTRDAYPGLKFIAGGAMKPREGVFDQRFVGESEDALVTWCQEQLGQKGRQLFNRKFDITELGHRFDDTDCILPNEVLPIELGRGCIFKCRFCAHKNLGKAKHTYQRRHDLFLDEVRYNKERFGTTRYMYLDDTVNEDVDKVANLARMPDDLGFEVEWMGYVRADLVWAKKEQPAQLLRSGMRTCLFGIETLDLEAGRAVDKSWGARHAREYLPELYHNLWGKQVNIYTSLIAGLPGEGYESFQKTVDWFYEQDLGYTRISPLALYTHLKDEHMQSEFTRNHAQYGYTNVRDDGYWEHGEVDLMSCLKFCEQANAHLNEVNRVSCWGLAGIANVTPFSFTHLMQQKSSSMTRMLNTAGRLFVARYLDLLNKVAQNA